MPRSLHVQCTFNVRSLSAHCERMVPVVKSMRSVKEGVGSVTGCILNSAFAALSLQLLQRESTLLRVRLGKAFLFVFGPQATFTSNTPTSVKEGVGSVTGCILNSAFAALSLQLLQREHFAQGTVGGRNPAPLYLHPKTNPRTPSLTLGHCLVVRKKEVE